MATESGWLGKIGGLLSGSKAPPDSQAPSPLLRSTSRSPSSGSYDDDTSIVEALEKERHLLKRKLAQETKNAQRSSEDKDKKIRELQQRDIRATRKSAQEIGMLQEERKLRKQLEDRVLQEQQMSDSLRRENELMEEDRKQLKEIIRRFHSDGEDFAAENRALKSQVAALQQHVAMLSVNTAGDSGDSVPAAFSHSSDISEMGASETRRGPGQDEPLMSSLANSALLNRASRWLSLKTS